MCTGKDVHPQVKQAFTDPKTQQFDPSNVIRFLKDLPNRDETVQKQWRTFEDAIRDERISNKYKDMVKTRYEHKYGWNPRWVSHMRTPGEAGTVKVMSKMHPKLKEKEIQ